MEQMSLSELLLYEEVLDLTDAEIMDLIMSTALCDNAVMLRIRDVFERMGR